MRQETKEGDLVMEQLHVSRFSIASFNKLEDKKIGHFQISREDWR